MSAQAARRLTTSPSEPARRNRRPSARLQTAPSHETRRHEARRQEARRRLRLIRRRRLDLLQDATIALGLALFALIDSAGLGVVAVLSLLTGAGLMASLLVERWLRRRQ
jgi:hypothetical protein